MVTITVQKMRHHHAQSFSFFRFLNFFLNFDFLITSKQTPRPLSPTALKIC